MVYENAIKGVKISGGISLKVLPLLSPIRIKKKNE
jgi:hypothetical protein